VTHFEGIKQQWQKKFPLSKWQWQEQSRNSVNGHCNGIAVQLVMSKTMEVLNNNQPAAISGNKEAQQTSATATVDGDGRR